MKPEWTDDEGYPSADYLNAVTDAVTAAGYTLDNSDEEEHGVWFSVSHRDETVSLTWQLEDRRTETGFDPNVKPTDPGAESMWVVRWWDADSDYKTGTETAYGNDTLIPEPADVVDLVRQVIDKRTA